MLWSRERRDRTATTGSGYSAALLVLVVLFQPCHLNPFELGFVGFQWIVVEIHQLGDPLVQIREPHMGRVHFRKLFVQRESDVVEIAPGELRHRLWFP